MHKIERRGADGVRRIATFNDDGRLTALKTLDVWNKGHSYLERWFWKTVWKRSPKSPTTRMHSDRARREFEAFGVNDPVAFINARHVFIRRAD